MKGESSFIKFVDSFYGRENMGCDWKRWYLYVCGNPDKFGVPSDHEPTRHCWMVNANIIVYFLIAAGFEPMKVRKCRPGGSEVAELRDPCFDNRDEISFFVEAKK